ncbi:MAG: hypothetical protein IJS29_03610 [Selenomonadaceae bacterium]|nr:hypothetical protein [Selenomonadaceae bacterium]
MKIEHLKKGIFSTLEQVKNALSRNKLKKIIALIMSITLWFYVMGAQNPTIEDSYRVKVHLRNNSYDYKAFYEEQEAKVTLSAPRSYFIDYTEKDIRAFADISSYSEGEYDVPIEVNHPKGFELTRISPETIHVKIEPIVERQMDLQLIPSGSPSPHTIITGIQAPQNITIIGPKNIIDTVKKVVGYIGVVGESEDFELNVPLSAIDENGREVASARVAPSSVNVLVQIEKSVIKSVPIVANLTPPDGKEISNVKIEPSTVEIEGIADVVNSIDSLNTIDAAISKDVKAYKEKLKLVIPEGLKVSVEEVLVTAEIKAAQQ